MKDFFRTYKDFKDAQLDTIEILLMKLYARFGITDTTDYSTKNPTDFPVMSDFYDLCEEEYMTYDNKRKYLYTEEILQEVCLGIHSMCVGSESKYFNGHTNITDDKFLCFGVKGLLDTNKRLKDAMLASLTDGCVKINAVVFPTPDKMLLGFDILVKDTPESEEWICYDTLSDEIKLSSRSIEESMFDILNREVKEYGLSYTECNFEVINDKVIK